VGREEGALDKSSQAGRRPEVPSEVGWEGGAEEDVGGVAAFHVGYLSALEVQALSVLDKGVELLCETQGEKTRGNDELFFFFFLATLLIKLTRTRTRK
jgi:hypothetical protein